VVVIKPEMYRSREAGVSFINGIITDFEALSDRVECLDAGLKEERRLRIESTDATIKRLSEMDLASTERSDEIATSLGKWASSLGAQSLQFEDTTSRMQALEEDLAGRMAELESMCRASGAQGLNSNAILEEDLAARMAELESTCRAGGAAGELAGRIALQAQADDLKRQLDTLCKTVALNDKNTRSDQAQADALKMQLDTLCETVALNDKNTLSDFGRLSGSLAACREEIKGSRNGIEALAVDGGRGCSTNIVGSVQQLLERFHDEALLQPKDVNRMAFAEDHSRLVAKVESLASTMEARSQLAEASLQAMTLELGRKATSTDLKVVIEEVGRKASNTEFQSFRETISHLSFQVTLNQTILKELESVVSPLPSNMQALASSVKAVDRKQDTESERTNACWVSLEKEVGTKSARSDLEQLVSRINSLETGRDLAPLIASKASIRDLQGLTARTEALEAGYGSKADGKTFERAKLTLSNQLVRHDELQSTTESKFEALSSQMHSLISKAEGKISKRSEQLADENQDRFNKLQDQLEFQVGRESLCTKDVLDQQLQDFYPKSEVDALLARIWWRLGQTGKVVGMSCLSTTRPERPQSARPLRPAS